MERAGGSYNTLQITFLSSSNPSYISFFSPLRLYVNLFLTFPPFLGPNFFYSFISPLRLSPPPILPPRDSQGARRAGPAADGGGAGGLREVSVI